MSGLEGGGGRVTERGRGLKGGGGRIEKGVAIYRGRGDSKGG